jgi:hypothetical protein
MAETPLTEAEENKTISTNAFLTYNFLPACNVGQAPIKNQITLCKNFDVASKFLHPIVLVTSEFFILKLLLPSSHICPVDAHNLRA